jgi:hypothetical protein
MTAVLQTPTIPAGMDVTHEYLRLISGVKVLLEDRVNTLAASEKPGVDHLRNAVALTVARLESEQAKSAVAFAVAQLEPSVADALGSELRYINANLPRDGNFIFDDAAKAEAADDAKTGKGSLEDLLGKWLPEWLKSTLRVLNELLSLAFKGGT